MRRTPTHQRAEPMSTIGAVEVGKDANGKTFSTNLT